MHTLGWFAVAAPCVTLVYTEATSNSQAGRQRRTHPKLLITLLFKLVLLPALHRYTIYIAW